MISLRHSPPLARQHPVQQRRLAVRQPKQQQQQQRSARASAAAPNAAAASTAATELKAKIRQLAGSNGGHDLDAAARTALEAACGELGALGGGAPAAASVKAGETWVPLYNNSKGNSSGKLGPFVTKVTQVFPGDEPGIYYNVSQLGPLSLSLRGKCGVSPAAADRVDLEFESVTARVFGVQVAQKQWAAGAMRGHWRAKYWDGDLRVFTTNKGSLFVMALDEQQQQ